MMNANVNGGRCQCAWGQLYKIMPDDLIAIIDGYTHISEYIADAVFNELNRIVYNQYYARKRINEWTFCADTLSNYGFDMGSIGCKLDGDADITCKLRAINNDAGTSQCCLSIDGWATTNLKWDGLGLTPFARINRRSITDFLMYNSGMVRVTGVNKNPFDTMCDGAHAAIWIWFHGGKPE